MLAAFPAAKGQAPTAWSAFNFLANGAGPYNQNAFDTRIDFTASQSVQVFGRFSLDYFSLSGKGSLGALGGVGFGPGGLAGGSIVHNYSLASGVTKTFSPSLLADFRFGYFKYNPHTHKPDEGADAHDHRRNSERKFRRHFHLRVGRVRFQWQQWRQFGCVWRWTGGCPLQLSAD